MNKNSTKKCSCINERPTLWLLLLSNIIASHVKQFKSLSKHLPKYTDDIFFDTFSSMNVTPNVNSGAAPAPCKSCAKKKNQTFHDKFSGPSSVWHDCGIEEKRSLLARQATGGNTVGQIYSKFKANESRQWFIISYLVVEMKKCNFII